MMKTGGCIVMVIFLLIVAGVVVCIPGFIAIGKCGSFGAGYTGCLVGPECSCSITSAAPGGQKYITTTASGCAGLGGTWGGNTTTGVCSSMRTTPAMGI